MNDDVIECNTILLAHLSHVSFSDKTLSVVRRCRRCRCCRKFFTFSFYSPVPLG